MSSAPPDNSTATPDYHRPRVLHVPAEKGVVKWMSGDVYETMATADSTNGALGFTVCWVPPGGGPIAHVHKSADESFYLISGSLEFLNGDQTFMANLAGRRGRPRTRREARILAAGARPGAGPAPRAQRHRHGDPARGSRETAAVVAVSRPGRSGQRVTITASRATVDRPGVLPERIRNCTLWVVIVVPSVRVNTTCR